MMGVVYDRYVYKLLNDILKMKKYPYGLRSRNNSNLDTALLSSVILHFMQTFLFRSNQKNINTESLQKISKQSYQVLYTHRRSQ